MSRLKICFATTGLQTTLQDFGRSGFQHLGVPSGGAMDRFSAAIANRLVGNFDESPVFEIALLGPCVEFSGDCQIAITGADLSPLVDGVRVPAWETVNIAAGAKLTFGARQSGCRSYMAIAGMIDVPKWLGSVSPLPAGDGSSGLKSIVAAGQTFEVSLAPGPQPKKVFDRTRRPVMPVPSQTTELPIVRGPEWELFSKEQQRAFLETEFRIRSQSNRMGYRLNSFWESSMSLPPMISSGVTPGVVQITPDGHPILLMRDAQTTGGYPRIAVVKYESINLAAQLSPGDQIRFVL